MPTGELREAMTQTSATYQREGDEFAAAGLETAPSRLVAPPRVAASPCAIECRVVHRIDPEDVNGPPTDQPLVTGQVVGAPLDERYVVDGIVDTAAMRPIARCGYRGDY